MRKAIGIVFIAIMYLGIVWAIPTCVHGSLWWLMPLIIHGVWVGCIISSLLLKWAFDWR
jgi:hypothetical protein